METEKQSTPYDADESDHGHRSNHPWGDGDGVVDDDHGHRTHRSNCCAADENLLGR